MAADLLFQGSRDLDYWKATNRERYKKLVKPTDVYLYDRVADADQLNGENMDQTFHGFTRTPSYTIEAYFKELGDWEAKLTKFGVDERRPLKGYFFIDSFTEKGVQPPRIGDHIVVQGERYKVMQNNFADYFGNTQEPMTYVVELQRTRPDVGDTTPRTQTEDEVYPQSQLAQAFQILNGQG